ncbi:hypothetical protein NQ317_007442 [Molorchus minor]|uniref:Peptidase S1 domain-containing protein n=1 Tax=Molorchus minor TaxID=1323400 RepID=A0ABQ9JHJ4_9CUCU|nr:hypothetical protein NQ317_007442 [Molorchus minor]
MSNILILLTALGTVWGWPSLRVPDSGGRIVGGHDADIKDYPYQLALLLYNQHYCGAVIVAPKWALTAAHCVDHGLYSTLAVRAGSSSKSSGGQVVRVANVTMHPLYNISTANYDFAVLELAESITAEDAAAIPLPEANTPVEEGQVAVVTGWGTLTYQGTTPEILQVVEVPVVGTESCRRSYGSLLTESMFCAGLEEGGKDACQGDSGGPIAIDGHLAGLVSWGSICAYPNRPGVYADVAYVMEWILEQIDETQVGPQPAPELALEPELDSKPESKPEPEPGSISNFKLHF